MRTGLSPRRWAQVAVPLSTLQFCSLSVGTFKSSAPDLPKSFASSSSQGTLSLDGKVHDGSICGSNKSHHLRRWAPQGKNRSQLLQPRQVRHRLQALSPSIPPAVLARRKIQLEPVRCTPQQVHVQRILLVLAREFPAGGRRHAPGLYTILHKR